MTQKVSLFWFRRDLRLEDNKALNAALNSGNIVLPLFIFDQEILNKLEVNDARVAFIHQCLESINRKLTALRSGLSVYTGRPSDVFKKLLAEFDLEAVYTNADYEPYALKRDSEISDLLGKHNIPLRTFKDQVIFEPNEVLKGDGQPYLVYTPYMKSWRAKLAETAIKIDSEFKGGNLIQRETFPWISLRELGFEKSAITVQNADLSSSLIDNYQANRNTPSKSGTSRLGPHLRFGTVSIRKMIMLGLESKDDTFLKELVWREFFMQILFHFPHSSTQCFKPQYDRIEWRNNPEEFQKWCEGQTGYPLVDAGMRELNATGFMHNRVRMLVGSFLCKHLLIDWRLGEAYFASKLLDYEMSSNVGNWQWVAGCGVDAAPYFRIFNPHTQIDKFDPKHLYIKKWVPELNELTYPLPMVDHKFARERCLNTYKAALNR
ncbi:MAG: deoxyribodipyrimidine photo-lyase [Bacteroidetes bacterium]|nr:deoxyribodipyrimidine photo-lyase [Bacteroidota bacterium]MDA0878910.1 deoxyribodipyrimidine photo-lyase [Bacteroidota bacterium]MDA1115103.1 deoxyribodipyrimidine photo-lyase [Bacteroidota bacterium]